MDNAHIADRLQAFAALLELAEANPYTIRAYRRAADTIVGAPVPVADLVRAGRARDLRGIGPSIEARLRELVALGISYFVVSGGSPQLVDNWRRVSEEVIPRFAAG